MSQANRKQYEKFTSAMHTEYERAVKKIREELSQGRAYTHACDTLTDISQELKSFIKEDLLKIIIAEEHFGAGTKTSDLALLLELPHEKIEFAKLTLLNDMVRETEYHRGQQTQTNN